MVCVFLCTLRTNPMPWRTVTHMESKVMSIWAICVTLGLLIRISIQGVLFAYIGRIQLGDFPH